jgi:hypothetical protein
MTPRERYERFQKQPEYVQLYARGLTESTYYSVLFEGKKFAVLRRDGHSWYRGAYGGCMAYAPLACYLIRKDNRGYWRDSGKEIHSGRLTKAALQKCEDILKEAEARGYEAN